MKKFITEMCSSVRGIPINFNLKMKITAILFVFAFVQINAANSFGQNTKVSLKMNQVTIQSILNKIEQKTDYKFLYEKNVFQNNKIVSVNVKNKQLSIVLDKLFEDQNVTIVYLEKQIVIKTKPETNTISLPENLKPETSIDQQSISGVVIDQNGVPLPGASVLEKGTTNGTQTDFDGNFTLNVRNGAILEISYLGFITQEIVVTEQSTINVQLKANTATLDEVVVVGFGTQKKANVTGATTTVQFDDVLGDRPVTNSIIALQGAIPGLQINTGSGRPGATNTSINIRGFESINGGSPLILMDNVPVSINDINPDDIASVSVLKDAAASSIYGGRAAFGVILITTKKGKKDSKPRFNYSSTIAISSPTELAKPASPLQFVNTLLDAGTGDYFTGQDLETWRDLLIQYNGNPNSLETVDGVYFDPDSGQPYPLRQNDIIGDFLDQTGYTKIHNMGFRGGSEKSSYRMSLGYSDENGVMASDNDSFKRYNVNATVRTDIASNLSASFTTNYRASTTLNPVTSYTNSVQQRSFSAIGNHIFEDGTSLPYSTPGNLARYRTPGKNEVSNIRMTGSVDFKPLKDLTITGEYTYENRNTNSRSSNNSVAFVSPFRLTPEGIPPSDYNRSYANTIYKALNVYARYKKNIKNHNFSLLVGFNDETNHAENFAASIDNLISVDLPSLDLGTENPLVSDGFGEWAVQGVFGRFSYNFKEKYFLEANGRYDGSSKFPESDRFGFFPSFSAGWIFSKESFFEPIKSVVSFLKFRGSYGEVGNQQVSNYPFLPTLGGQNANWVNPDSATRYTTLGSLGLVSSSFTWERVRTLNFGVDTKFFNNKLSAEFDIYTRETLDMLIPGAELPATLGAVAPLANNADVETKGWEAQVSWRDRIGKDFTYRLSVNINDNQAKITKFDNEEGLLSQYYVGEELGDIWGYVTDGFYTIDDFVDGTLDANLLGGTLKDGVVPIRGRNVNPGDVKFLDLDGDGEINSGNSTLTADIDPTTGELIPLTGPGDRKVIGNSNRHLRFGINGSMGYKNFDLSFRITGVGKRDLYINNQLFFPYVGEFNNVFAHQSDYWTPTNTDAYYPRNYERGSNNYGSSRRTQTKYLQDASFWTLRNVTIGYALPSNLLDKIFFTGVRMSLSGENLFIKDKLPPGLNPEFSNLGGGGTYPHQKQFAFGINLEF